MSFENGLVQIQDPTTTSRVLNITQTGSVNSANVVIRDSTGSILDSFPITVDLDYTEDDVTVYGSQGVALQQKLTSNDLIVTLDGEVVAASQSGTWNIGTLSTITNVVHIDDNSGSITVDNNGTFAVQAAQSGTWNISTVTTLTSITNPVAVTQSGTWNVATVTTLTSITNPVAVTQSGTWTVQPGNTANTVAWLVKLDQTTTNNDVDANITNATLAVTQSGTWNIGTVTTVTTVSTLTSITNVVHVDDNSGSLTVDNNGTFAVQAAQSGTWNVGTVTTLTSITNAVTVAQATASSLNATVVGTGTFAMQPAGSVAHDGAASGVNPVLIGGYASAAAPSNVSTTTDSVRAWYLLNGAQATVLTAAGALIGGDATNGIDVDVTRVTGTVTTTAVGTVADDATTPGAPVMVGGDAVETDGTDPTSVSAEADVARFRTDRNRRLLINSNHPNNWSLFEDHTSAQTNNQLKAAPGANLSLYITDVVVSNGATAGSIKLIEDEGGTPVQISQTIYMAINGGAVIHWNTPKRMTANKTLGFTSTTVTTHSIEVHGYTAP